MAFWNRWNVWLYTTFTQTSETQKHGMILGLFFTICYWMGYGLLEYVCPFEKDDDMYTYSFCTEVHYGLRQQDYIWIHRVSIHIAIGFGCIIGLAVLAIFSQWFHYELKCCYQDTTQHQLHQLSEESIHNTFLFVMMFLVQFVCGLAISRRLWTNEQLQNYSYLEQGILFWMLGLGVFFLALGMIRPCIHNRYTFLQTIHHKKTDKGSSGNGNWNWNWNGTNQKKNTSIRDEEQGGVNSSDDDDDDE